MKAVLVGLALFRILVVTSVSSELFKVGSIFLIVLSDELCVHYLVGRVEFVFTLLSAESIALGWNCQEVVS